MKDPAKLKETAETIKSCCANLYETDAVRLLLGESFHPGGLALTTKLGQELELSAGSHVLDVASGQGASALHLARLHGCSVTGIDYGGENVRNANLAAEEAGLQNRVSFRRGDSETLPFDDGSFDAIVCECAFCTFPDKMTAAGEFHRVLKPAGRVGISDITRAMALPPELDTLMAWAACIGDARPLDGYTDLLAAAGFRIVHTSMENAALRDMVSQVRMRLLGLEVATGLKKLDLPHLDLPAVREVLNATRDAIEKDQLGYALIVAVSERTKSRQPAGT